MQIINKIKEEIKWKKYLREICKPYYKKLQKEKYGKELSKLYYGIQGLKNVIALCPQFKIKVADLDENGKLTPRSLFDILTDFVDKFIYFDKLRVEAKHANK